METLDGAQGRGGDELERLARPDLTEPRRPSEKVFFLLAKGPWNIMERFYLELKVQRTRSS